MKIMIGNRQYGFKDISNDFSYGHILDHYVSNVAYKYEATEANVKLAEKYLKKLDYKKIACFALPIALAFISGDISHAQELASDLINTQPLDDLFHQLYLLFLKVGGYTLLPIMGWSGWTLLTGGTSPEKRTVAKNIIIYGCLGFLLIAGSPWLKDAVVHASTWVFSKH